MKLFDKMKKKMNPEPTGEPVKSETVNLVPDKTGAEIDLKAEAEKKAKIEKFFSGVYDINSFAANPLLVQITTANLLYDVREELQVLNATLARLFEELEK